jgi:hypothetical protein
MQAAGELEMSASCPPFDYSPNMVVE